MLSIPSNKISDRNSYSSIIKAISLFGGVKIFQIFISIIRSKIIAILIGPHGMGVANLLTSTVMLVTSLTGCGLETSAVRDISKAFSSNDSHTLNITISVLRKIVWVTGILGTVITFFLSPYLSILAFGDMSYSTSFQIISLIIIFNQINVGQTVLLQGTFEYKNLSKAALYGNLAALLITLPLYFLWGLDGIVPAIIISAVITLLFSWIYSKKIKYVKTKFTIYESLLKGKKMIILGLALALVGLIGQLNGYIMNIFISKMGSITDVGLYSAGYSIANTYVFILLSSMSSDYVPRLSSAADDNTTNLINKQSILLVTLVTPLIVFFIIFIKEIIILLYSKEFLPIIGMIEWIMFGMLFRSLSWALSYSLIARGKTKVFLYNEILIFIISICTNVIGYKYMGFTGLGLSFVLIYLLYSLQLIYFCKQSLGFHFSSEFFKILITPLILCTLSIGMSKILEYSIYRYIFGAVIFTVSVYLSFQVLNKLMELKLLKFSPNLSYRFFKK